MKTLRQSYPSLHLAKPDQVLPLIRDIALTGAFTYDTLVSTSYGS